MFSVPAAFVLGIVGILKDPHKLPAFIATVIGGALVLLWMGMVGLS